MRLKRVVGIILTIAGFAILANNFSGIIGYVIFSGLGKGYGYLTGLGIFVVGALLLMAGREKTAGGLEKMMGKSQKKQMRKLREARTSGAIWGYNELISVTKKAGYVVRGTGGTHNLQIFYHDGKTALRDDKTNMPVTIPSHKEPATGTYKKILKSIVAHDPYEHVA